MKQIDRLIMKAKRYEEMKNPHKCAFIGMVLYSDTIGKWTGWVDIAAEGEIKANKPPYKSYERITAEADTKEEIMEKITDITNQYHSDSIDASIIICDWTYRTDDELRDIIDSPDKLLQDSRR